jgi:hypothetical protein
MVPPVNPHWNNTFGKSHDCFVITEKNIITYSEDLGNYYVAQIHVIIVIIVEDLSKHYSRV